MENTKTSKNRATRRAVERNPDAWMTVQQASEYTGYHPQTLRKLIRMGDLACIRRGGSGHIRIRRSALDQWARRNTVKVREALG